MTRAIVGAAISTIACASRTPPPTTPGDAATHQHEHVSELPASPGPGFTVADVRFMQNMIGHHAQAITMAGLAPSRGASDNVLRLAQKIDISQRDEIELMKHWLTERKQAVPDDAQAHAMMMPGMLTAEQLAQLKAARDREFDQLFLTFMIAHHEGALQMVEQLFKSHGAGQDSDIFRFATDVDADQRDEILAMQQLLDIIRGN